MTCSEFCDLVAAWKDGRVPDEHLALGREHIEECRACRDIIEKATSAAPPAKPPEPNSSDLAFIDRLRQKGSDLSLATTPTIEGYDSVIEVARGGMGAVFKARQLSLNRLVALKIMLHGDLASSKDRQRFEIEAKSIAQLRHPNIVRVFEYGTFENKPYFTMEYVEGATLSEWITSTTISYTCIAEILTILANAVHHAHQHRLIHRDLKPSNVLIDSSLLEFSLDNPTLGISHALKIADFGLVKTVAGGAQSFTSTGEILGTPEFMAPEQIGNSPITAATDVYGLGAILYYLLTGTPPFQGNDPYSLIQRVIKETPVYPSEVRSDVPLLLERICMKCLEKRASHRYTTAKQLADDLISFVNGKPLEHLSIDPHDTNASPTLSLRDSLLGCMVYGVLGGFVSLILTLPLILLTSNDGVIFGLFPYERKLSAIFLFGLTFGGFIGWYIGPPHTLSAFVGPFIAVPVWLRQRIVRIYRSCDRSVDKRTACGVILASYSAFGTALFAITVLAVVHSSNASLVESRLNEVGVATLTCAVIAFGVGFAFGLALNWPSSWVYRNPWEWMSLTLVLTFNVAGPVGAFVGLLLRSVAMLFCWLGDAEPAGSGLTWAIAGCIGGCAIMLSAFCTMPRPTEAIVLRDRVRHLVGSKSLATRIKMIAASTVGAALLSVVSAFWGCVGLALLKLFLSLHDLEVTEFGEYCMLFGLFLPTVFGLLKAFVSEKRESPLHKGLDAER